MGKDRSEKKEKKEKKERLVEDGGVTKTKDKKEKKSRKDKTEKTLNGEKAAEVVQDALRNNEEEEEEDPSITQVTNAGEKTLIIGALVPFANPLADDKGTKKVLKGVKKAAKNKTLKRGVKEVVKSLRKSPLGGPSSSTVPGIVILAADISPMDVISHIPVLCEDHNVPYIYVASRAELGMAGNTKRPTSVVMVSEKRTGKGQGEDKETEEEFAVTYKELLKFVEKEGRNVRV